MKKKFFTTLIGPAAFILCLGASSASAGLDVTYHTTTDTSNVTVTELTDPVTYGTDYISNRRGGDSGDAPASYGSATHGNGQWQGLGMNAHTDDGVTWSVDGGATFNNTSALTAGEEVTFKFLFWQANNGAHDYDQILAALDGFDGNGINDTFGDHGDTLLYAKIDTTHNLRGITGKDTTLDYARFIEFDYTMTIAANMSGETWLRVRSTCWHGDDAWPGFDTVGYASQGETEDYMLTINPVPEPSTMLLFGSGLLGLAGLKRRKK